MDARLDLGQIVARRLDRRHGLGERRKALLPGSDRLVQFRLALTARGDRRALAGIERAERIFGGGKIVLGREAHDKQSRS